MKETKRLIRTKILETLHTIPKHAYYQLSEQTAQHVFQQDYWQEAHTIAVTISRFPEVQTDSLMKRAWAEGKRVAVPRINPKTKQMNFYIIDHLSQLEETVYGLLEPIPSETTYLPIEEIEVMVVPGVAFTREGGRLGLGGGYYDRYLTTYTGITVSLAFSEQLVPFVPMAPHDYRIHHIVSPGGVIL